MKHLMIPLPTQSDWQQAAEYNQFPILPSTRRALQKQLKQTDLSFDKVASIAEQDPALCWHLLQKVAKINPTSVEQIHSVNSCISLLGMQQVVAIAKHLPVLKVDSRPQLNYLQSVTGSVLAARLARDWVKYKPIMSGEKAYWEAALVNSVTWPWQLDQVQNWQACMYHMTQGQDIFNAMRHAFGNSKQAKWQQLSSRYQLPYSCRNLWTPQPWPSKTNWLALRRTKLQHIDGMKEFKHLCQQPELFIYFANCLAWNYRIAPYSSNSRRWLTLAANYLNVDRQQLHQSVVQHMLSLARSLKLKLPLGCQLLLAPKDHHYPYPQPIICCDRMPMARTSDIKKVKQKTDSKKSPPLKQNTSAPVEKAQPEQRQPLTERTIDHTKFKNLLAELTHNPENFRDWNVLMSSVLTGITQDIGLPRSYVAVLNKDSSALKIYYQVGLDGNDPLSQWQLDLTQASAFNKILQRPASIIITAENRDKMLRGLAEHTKQILPSEFMMMSLFSNKRPVGILFADTGAGQQLQKPIANEEYTAFKTLALTATKCITTIAKQRKDTATKNKKSA